MSNDPHHRAGYGAEDQNIVIDVRDILEDLHRGALCASISWGRPRRNIDVALGDHVKGYIVSAGQEDEILTIARATLWLRDQACRLYPNSRFAGRYRHVVERGGAIYTPGSRWAHLSGCTCPRGQPSPPDGTYRINPKCSAHGFI